MPISDEERGKLGAKTAERKQKLKERREKKEARRQWKRKERALEKKSQLAKHPPKHIRQLRAACEELCLRVACGELYSAVERDREERDEIKGASVEESEESEDGDEEEEEEGEGEDMEEGEEGEGEDMEEGEEGDDEDEDMGEDKDGEDEAEREKVRELVEMFEREMEMEEEKTDA
ncbi:hypothetical protein L207DRAFT_627738 [Hyaloscypha variabilis F]|uniref:Uncharacterized protein n=1 Tax=Hyaloscypha variabilis (strain UAMH 11265 / GT02V1 / F) TaxID=1149755 RepID=A0A2J6S898_HYAVF|nr:hypothetical protein L207DRAFT_627738 [Hyaloscypha variabilis F]